MRRVTGWPTRPPAMKRFRAWPVRLAGNALINPNAGAVVSETATERQKRLAQALRANLRKRKTQTRERAADPSHGEDARAQETASPDTASPEIASPAPGARDDPDKAGAAG